MKLLTHLMVYILGFLVGFLVTNISYMFFLLVIPNIVIYYILDKRATKTDKILDDYLDKHRKWGDEKIVKK